MGQDDKKRPILISSNSFSIPFTIPTIRPSTICLLLASLSLSSQRCHRSPPLSPQHPTLPPADNDSISNYSLPLPPQLAIQSLPIDSDEKDSTIDYEREPATFNDNDEAPIGFVPNDPDSRQYYPIYVPNPLYGQEDESCMMVAKYVWYSPDCTMVTGCNSKGYPQHNLPVTIRRQTCVTQRMTATNWKELQRGSPQEFMVNKALANMGDPRVIGAVNRLRGKMEVDESLSNMLQDARHMVDKLTAEHWLNQQELVNIKNNIERANLHALVQDQYW
jgi:hypothetical protein